MLTKAPPEHPSPGLLRAHYSLWLAKTKDQILVHELQNRLLKFITEMILLKSKLFLLVWIRLFSDKRLFWFQKLGFEYLNHKQSQIWTINNGVGGIAGWCISHLPPPTAATAPPHPPRPAKNLIGSRKEILGKREQESEELIWIPEKGAFISCTSQAPIHGAGVRVPKRNPRWVFWSS